MFTLLTNQQYKKVAYYIAKNEKLLRNHTMTNSCNCTHYLSIKSRPKII